MNPCTRTLAYSYSDCCIYRPHSCILGRWRQNAICPPTPNTNLPEQESKSFLLRHPADFFLDLLSKVVSHSSLSGAQVSRERELSWQVLELLIQATVSQKESNSEALNRLVQQYKQEVNLWKHLCPQFHFPPWTVLPHYWRTEWTGMDLGCLILEGALSRRFLQFYGPVGMEECKERG